MVATMPLDQAKVDAFVQKVFGDITGHTVSAMASIGDQLGLFKELDANGPATSEELAIRAGINERYAREWLGAMACAGYLTYDPTTVRFTLPPEHGPVLVQEGGPAFLGGLFRDSIESLRPYDQLVEAFRTGGGVPRSAFRDEMYEAMARFTRSWFENFLVQLWIPAMPDVQARLERGALVADVGCGRGLALIKLAQAFPESRFVGYDGHAPNVTRAIANAEAAGVADQVRFEVRDVAGDLPERYDVITTFDVIHDATDPEGLQSTIRRALRPDGIYATLEINCSDKLEENIGPLGACFMGVSVLYCMTVSLAEGGAGLGTFGLPEPKVRELCERTGFSEVRRVPLDDPFNSLYEIRP